MGCELRAEGHDRILKSNLKSETLKYLRGKGDKSFLGPVGPEVKETKLLAVKTKGLFLEGKRQEKEKTVTYQLGLGGVCFVQRELLIIGPDQKVQRADSLGARSNLRKRTTITIRTSRNRTESDLAQGPSFSKRRWQKNRVKKNHSWSMGTEPRQSLSSYPARKRKSGRH